MKIQNETWVWVPFEVDRRFDGWRVDRFLAKRLTGYSRTKIQRVLSEARVVLGGRLAKPSARVHAGEQVQIAYLRRPEPPLTRDASIPVLYEDRDFLIVDKPSGLLCHPTDKVVRHTVLGILRHSRPELRPIHLLHRLDRETSGVLALAKNKAAAQFWSRHMDQKKIRKEYLAFVRGLVRPVEGVLDAPIGPEQGEIRVRQGVHVPNAVRAVTRYRVESPRDVKKEGWSPSRSDGMSISIVRVFPETGRLHQIRVHFSAIGHPLLGDPLYTDGGEVYQKMIAGRSTEADRRSLGFPRVALHAAALTFPLLSGKRTIEVRAPLAEDMRSFRCGTEGSFPLATAI